MLATAQQAANALDRAQQHEGERRAREHLAFISRASEILGGSLDLDATLRAPRGGRGPRGQRLVHRRPRRRGRASAERRRRAHRPRQGQARRARCGSAIRPTRREPRGRERDPHGPARALSRGSPRSCSSEGARDEEHLRMMRELGLVLGDGRPAARPWADSRRDHLRLRGVRAPLQRGTTSPSRRSSPGMPRSRSTTRRATCASTARP